MVVVVDANDLVNRMHSHALEGALRHLLGVPGKIVLVLVNQSLIGHQRLALLTSYNKHTVIVVSYNHTEHSYFAFEWCL